MGGNSSSTLDSSDAEVITVMKGIRLTDRVINRMKESPQAVYKSKSQAPSAVTQPLHPRDDSLSPHECLVPILPHPPSYASSLVPPPVQEPITPLVPLVPVSQDLPAPPSPEDSSTHAVAADHTVSPVEPPAQEHVALLLPTEPVTPSLPNESFSVVTGEPVDTSPSISTEPVVTSPAEAINLTAEPAALSFEPTVPSPSKSPLEPVELTTDTSSSAEPAGTSLPTALAAKPGDVTETSSLPVPASQTEVPSPQARIDESTDMLGSPPGEPGSSPSPLSIPLPPSPDLEELDHPQSSSALAVPSELPSLGQMQPPPPEETPAPPSSAPTVESVVPPVLPPLPETISLLTGPPKQQPAVGEEELRKQIQDELQKHLQEELKMAELKIREQLEEEKVKAKAEAQAKAQLQIQAEVQKTLEREQLALQQSLKDAVMKERMNAEDERLVAQYYWMERKVQKLEEKEQDLAKQDCVYREQITKLEEKTAQFTRVTAESFKKGLEDTRSRFKKYQIKPVCSELQSEILKCYREHRGQTLTCSNIASLYMQCVDNAKQNKKLSTGG